MRTNIDIDDALLSEAMKAGPYPTKREAVEAGLKLLARQVAYREIMKWRGKLHWEGDESIDWTKPPAGEAPRHLVARPSPSVRGRPTIEAAGRAGPKVKPSSATAQASSGKRRAGR